MSSSTSLDTGGRREARERAIELAYEASVRDWSVDQLVESLSTKPDPFVVQLLEWSAKRQSESDERIETKAEGWTLKRMPSLDVLVMRMAIAEMLEADTPIGVILSEATELAGRYSTDESGGFVNGVLAAIAEDIRN